MEANGNSAVVREMPDGGTAERSRFSRMRETERVTGLREQMRQPQEGVLIRNLLLARGLLQPVEGETAMLAVPMRRANAFA